jgi:predicted AlkP superfamily phosphohydrolase/phosphomutase
MSARRRRVSLLATLPALVLLATCNRPGRVVVLLVDGLHPPMLDALVAEGVLPNFGRLYREGSVGAIRTRDAGLPPFFTSILSSIATGQLPRENGIAGGFVAKDEAGALRLLSSRDRRAPAVWNIVSAAGKSVGVVNWVLTYPVEPVRGFVVSERYMPASSKKLAESIGVPLDLDPTRAVYPPDLRETLDAVSTMSPAPVSPELAAQVDRSVFALAFAALAKHPVDLVLIFTQALDELSHLHWHSHEALPGERFPRDFVVDYLQVYDGLLGELLARVGSQDHLVVLSDHGMERGNKSQPLSGQHETAATARGVLLLRGPLVRADNRIGEASMLDVLPTLLELLAIAPPDTLPGKVVTAALVPGHVPLPRHAGPYPAYRPDVP